MNHTASSSLPKVRSSAGFGQTKKYPPEQAQLSSLADFANAPCQQQSLAMHMISIDPSNLTVFDAHLNIQNEICRCTV